MDYCLVYDGYRVRSTDTPGSIQLEIDDVLQASQTWIAQPAHCIWPNAEAGAATAAHMRVL